MLIGETNGKRGDFHRPYLLDKNHENRRVKSNPRLLDLILCVAKNDDPDYLQDSIDAEFMVVDLLKKEKAWFDNRLNLDAEKITMMVDGHFDTSSLQVAKNIWVV